MRLNSFQYRLIWRLKKLFYGRRRLELCGPFPIILKSQPCRFYEPPTEIVQNVTVDARAKFTRLCSDLQILPRLTTFLPEQLGSKDWQQLLTFDNAKERLSYLTFLRQREKLKAKEWRKREEKRGMKRKTLLGEGEEEKEDAGEEEHHPPRKEEGEEVGNEEVRKEEEEQAATTSTSAAEEEDENSQPRLLFLPKLWRAEDHRATRRYIRSLQLAETPRIAVDCRFLCLHSRRALNLTMIQLCKLIGQNRNRQLPWPVCLANFPESTDDEMGRHFGALRDIHLKIVDSDYRFSAEISQCSYLELFPELKEQQNIVYLSPHAPEKLERVDADCCYVIGAIVDRVFEAGIPLKASLLTAQQEGLQCRRFPIGTDRLKSGSAMLTLDQVLAIMQDVFESPGNNDWDSALDRHLPKRKTQTAAEKNQQMRLRYQNIRERNWEIVRILDEIGEKNNQQKSQSVVLSLLSRISLLNRSNNKNV